MSLVPSLLQAILKVDGEALVMHAGEKPYVVAPAGQIELASRGLTLEAVDGIVGQLLPPELQRALDEFGAVQYELPAAPEFPREHFTVVAARGGDDLWTEIRRRRVPDEDDQIPADLFSARSASGAAAAVAEAPVAVAAAPPVVVVEPPVVTPPVIAPPVIAPPAIAARSAAPVIEPPAVEVVPVAATVGQPTTADAAPIGIAAVSTHPQPVAYQETFAGHETVAHHESVVQYEQAVHHGPVMPLEAVAHEPPVEHEAVRHDEARRSDEGIPEYGIAGHDVEPAHQAVAAHHETVAYQEAAVEDEELEDEEIEDDDLALGAHASEWFEEEEVEEGIEDDDDGLTLPDAEQLFGKRRKAETEYDEEFEEVGALAEGEEYEEYEEVEEFEDGDEFELDSPAPSPPAQAAQIPAPPAMFATPPMQIPPVQVVAEAPHPIAPPPVRVEVPPPAVIAALSQPFLLVPPPIVEAPRPLAQVPPLVIAPPGAPPVDQAPQPVAFVATLVPSVLEPPPASQPLAVVEEPRLVAEVQQPDIVGEPPAFETSAPRAVVEEQNMPVETLSSTTPAIDTPEPVAEVTRSVVEVAPPHVEEPPQALALLPESVLETPQPLAETPQPVAEEPWAIVEFMAHVEEPPQAVAPLPEAVLETSQPVAEASQPVAEEPWAVVGFAAHVEEPPAFAPLLETPQPVAEALQRGAEEPWAVVGFAAHVEELPQALAPLPEPVLETPLAVAEVSEPVGEEPRAVIESAAHVEEPPNLVAPLPEPVFETPPPVLEASPPVADESWAVVGFASNVEAPPQEVAASPEPDLETPQPVAEAPQPIVEFAAHIETPQPVAELPPPVIEAAAPAATLPEQLVEQTAEPDVEASAPIAEPSSSKPSWATLVPPAATVLSMSRNPIRSTGVQPPPVADPTMSGLDRLLRVSAARGASTLYLSTDAQPSVRVDGELQTIEGEPILSARDVESLLLTLMPERSHEALRTGAATEWFCDIDVVGRVRCLSFRDHRGPGGVFRLMPTRSVSVDQLGLPRSVQALAIEPEGLVLVAGPRSSGKRTLLSAFVDQINKTRRDHVITIEREVNIVHEQSSSFVSQREVRGNDDDMLIAARAALREDPDVLVIEDLRTAALMNVALEAASAGRLVVAGFSAHTAAGAIDRIIDLYPAEYRGQVQLALADCLRGVIVQVLLRKTAGGRVPAREVLLNTPAVSSVIAEGKTSQLAMAIEGGRRYGMMPINDGLVGLVQHGVVDAREAYRRSTDRPGFLAALKRHGIDTSFVERLA